MAAAAAGIGCGGGEWLARSVAWPLSSAGVCALVVLGGLPLRFLTRPCPGRKEGADPRAAAFFFLALQSDNRRCRVKIVRSTFFLNRLRFTLGAAISHLLFVDNNTLLLL
jgi:hypothetical protein